MTRAGRRLASGMPALASGPRTSPSRSTSAIIWTSAVSSAIHGPPYQAAHQRPGLQLLFRLFAERKSGRTVERRLQRSIAAGIRSSNSGPGFASGVVPIERRSPLDGLEAPDSLQDVRKVARGFRLPEQFLAADSSDGLGPREPPDAPTGVAGIDETTIATSEFDDRPRVRATGASEMPLQKSSECVRRPARRAPESRETYARRCGRSRHVSSPYIHPIFTSSSGSASSAGHSFRSAGRSPSPFARSAF
jgi:hypothetical protein